MVSISDLSEHSEVTPGHKCRLTYEVSGGSVGHLDRYFRRDQVAAITLEADLFMFDELLINNMLI